MYIHSLHQHSEGVKKLQRLDLSSFLIQPIQRIPRYELLLKDLIKHTWPSHPDYADLQLALLKIKEAAKLLNRAKSYNESREEILNLKQKLQSHAGGAGTKNAQHRQSMHAGAATVSAMSLAQAAGTDDNLKLNYISEGFIGYRDVTGSVDALCDSELDVDVSVQNLTLKPAVEGKHGSGTPATQPLYAYLFIDMLILMRKSKATDNHSGTLSKVLALSRNNSKGSKSTVMSSIALDRAVVDPCEGERRNGALTGRFLLRTSDGRTHEFTADGTLSKARWLCDLDEALGQRLSHASSMAVASASTLPSSMEGQGSCDGYLAIHAQSEEQMVTPAACTPTGSPDKRKSYGTLSSLRSLTGNKTRMSQSTDGLDTMCKSSGTTLEHSPSKLKRLLARKKSK